MKKNIRIIGQNYRFGFPTTQDWDRLADAVGEDDSRMHWERMYSWCFEEDNEFHATFLGYGYYSARFSDLLCESDYQGVDHGFRPAFEPMTPCALGSDMKDGDSVVVGTLYMNGKPVHVPKNPTKDGDIEDYIPGATLEVREALPDTDYQIHAIKTGDVLMADRNLLKRISWDDLEAQGFAEEIPDPPEREYVLPCTWMMSGTCKVVATSLKKAIMKAMEAPLPKDGEYIPDSLTIDEDAE